MSPDPNGTDPSEGRPTSAWWWLVSEAERDFWAGLSAAAARNSRDPEWLYDTWRADVSTPAEARYVEDLIARVSKHLAEGTGVRLKHPPGVDP
jgi:hypothetical protein